MRATQTTLDLFAGTEFRTIPAFKTQLLKWVGNKQRFAHEIASFFPARYGTFYEPFLGSGAVLGTLWPPSAVGSDVFQPLIEIWQTLQRDPERVVGWYQDRYRLYHSMPRPEGYEAIKATYNAKPNGPDLLFLSRSCYGGVVRFRKADGYMSTPCGVHDPITPTAFRDRVRKWHTRVKNTTFYCQDFEETMATTKAGDLVYCDPPYACSQAILYGGQDFSLARLLRAIASCKNRGVRVALSIDGKKKSGGIVCKLNIPDGLFEREVFIACGRSMLRRFQREGETLEDELVEDRLLLSY
ncbi:MAG: Dam family site-specific DNA-(adenine-N6)-methyltransferase [Bacteroidota bacterium]